MLKQVHKKCKDIRENAQTLRIMRLINKIRNEREVTIDITEIQRIMLEYYERLCATKFNNLREMDQFLET